MNFIQQIGDIFTQGGSVMYVLLFCSIIALTIIIERSLALRRSQIIPDAEIQMLETTLQSGAIAQALEVCRQSPSPMHRIVRVAIENRGVSRPVLKEILEEEGRQQVAKLEKFVGILSLIASIAPLLGLLGTVIGMIELFDVVSKAGTGRTELMAGGISKALYTTVGGLTVAIPSLVAFRWLEARVDNFVLEIEAQALRFVDLLKGER